MTTVTKFDRQNLSKLRAQMLARMEEVAKEFGLVAEFGRISFNDTKFTVKMEVTTQQAAEEATVDESVPLAVGQKIKHPARANQMEICDVKGPKIWIKSNRGKIYAITHAEAFKYRVAA